MARQSRQQASNAARRQAQLNQLDNLGSNRNEFDTASVFNVVENDAANFIQRVKANIQNEPDFVVTGKIEDIKTEITDTSLNIVIPAYLSYQDKGVNGAVTKKYNTIFTYRDKRPPVNVFVNWVKTKNIQLRNEVNYDGQPSPFADLTEDKQILATAYAMREKIYQEGFKPRNVYSKEIPQLVTDIQQSVTNYVQSFLTQTIISNDGSRLRV